MTSSFFVGAVLIVLLFGALSAVWAQPDTVLSHDFVHIEDTENLDLSKGLAARVAANPKAGFSFPYYLFVPQEMDSNESVYLLVEPCNTGTTSDDFESHDSKAKSLALKRSSHTNKIARKLKVPLLVPVFPRPGGERWRIYTHALDRDILLLKEGDLRRIDEQLIKMIAHAQQLLRHNNVKVNEQVFMNGFSASGTFTNRFAILHPKVVRAVATGGVNCIPTFPTDQWNGTAMRYPVGIADLKEIAGIDFDEAAYKRVSQYIYMGVLDNNDTLPYRDAYDEVDAELVKSLIGAEMMPDRWEMSQSIYRALGIPAQFVTYENTRHEIRREMIDDVVAFFKANSGTDIVEINPYQYTDERTIVLSASAATESGEHLADGTVTLRETDTTLTSATYGTRGMGKNDPSPRYMLVSYLVHHPTDLFRFPLVVGDTWTQEGDWDAQIETTLEGHEAVEVSADVFTICLKHKTVFTGADAGSELKSSLVNGTRYLWFARGVGLVKMRYEHANGVVTEAELLEYDVPVKGEEYLPLQIGNTWTYRWQNSYRDEAVIEKWQVADFFRYDGADLAQQGTTPPKVEKIIPDVSEKVSTDLKEIRVVFSERMQGMDVGFAGVPLGDIQWEDDNTTLVISFNQRLSPSKIYRLILGRNEGYRNMTGVPLEEYILTFTTEGTDPVTSTFVDMTPIHVTDIEELNLLNESLYRISTDLTDGFAFPYYLFVPQGIDSSKPVHLLIEPCNTGTLSDNFKIHDKNVKGFAEASHATDIARKLKVPLLVPVFPRPGGDRTHIYTHALDRDTLLIEEGGLRRIDLQLIKMINHAQRLLRYNDLKINNQVFMNGFSASGTFTNRFTILHPTVVRAVATGGINCIPTFPTDQWNGTTMRYPIGIADVKEIAAVEFEEIAYKKVSQYVYMGALDDNDTLPYRDAYDEVDAELVKSLIGAEMMPDRWEMSQSIYRALGIPAQFVTYGDTGHQIKSEMIDDIVAFFEANAGDKIVEIVPHQYPIGE